MNDFEATIYVTLKNMGYKVLRNGWPDLLIYDGNEFYNEVEWCVAAELKGPGDSLRKDQQTVIQVLNSVMPVVVERAADASNIVDAISKKKRQLKEKIALKEKQSDYPSLVSWDKFFRELMHILEVEDHTDTIIIVDIAWSIFIGVMYADIFNYEKLDKLNAAMKLFYEALDKRNDLREELKEHNLWPCPADWDRHIWNDLRDSLTDVVKLAFPDFFKLLERVNDEV